MAGGVEALILVFREKGFVGEEMAKSNDARDLSEEIVANRLAQCWNEALACLREMLYAMPNLLETISDHGNLLPFLFTLLSHDSCFDGAAALIEEILSLMSQPQQQVSHHQDSDQSHTAHCGGERTSPASTFFLGNVSNLFQLWSGFNCRQLAHFCRILALLIFEPEDRQLLESSTVLKSLELLQLRRNRAVRAGWDSTVDMNQAILLRDEQLLKRILALLRVMNFAPSLRRFSSYNVLANFPFIPDTLVMLGLSEIDDWDEIDRQEALARKLLLDNEAPNSSSDAHQSAAPLLSELGAVSNMLESLSATFTRNPRDANNQLGHIIETISAAQQAGVIVGRSWRVRHRNQNRDEDDEDAVPTLSMGGVSVDGATMQGLASVAGILTDQVLVRRSTGVNGQRDDERRHLINTSEDAANTLQFNAMLLGPYQVEVLFILCTLLGGRRKLDAQDILSKLQMIPVLDDMFQRLPWYKHDGRDNENANADDGSNGLRSDQNSNGIHGPTTLVEGYFSVKASDNLSLELEI